MDHFGGRRLLDDGMASPSCGSRIRAICVFDSDRIIKHRFAGRRITVPRMGFSIGSIGKRGFVVGLGFDRGNDGGRRASTKWDSSAGYDSWSLVRSRIGLRNSEFVWLAGAWLLWVQAVCQMYPLPKSLGRVAIVASISLVAARFQEVFQTHFARRAIQLCALASGMFAIVSIMLDPADFSPRWPLLMLLSLVLWVTSLGPDIREMVIGFGDFSGWNDGELMNPKPNRQTGSWLDNAKTSVVSMSRRRKLRQVMQREKQEADDIGRLDEVLNQLHTQGRDSLSSEDLALLNRVSESLRKERELEPK